MDRGRLSATDSPRSAHKSNSKKQLSLRQLPVIRLWLKFGESSNCTSWPWFHSYHLLFEWL